MLRTIEAACPAASEGAGGGNPPSVSTPHPRAQPPPRICRWPPMRRISGALVVAAALAVPAGAAARNNDSQHPSSIDGDAGACHLRGLNAAAKELARTAQITAEVVSTDHEGSYVRVSLATLHSYEPFIPITPREGRRYGSGAYLVAAAGTENSYIVTARAANGNTFSVTRDQTGEIVRFARVCGVRHSW